MKRIVAAVAAILLIAGMAGSAVAAPPAGPTGTISIVTPEPRYQDPLEVAWSVSGKAKPYYYPMVYIECYQSLDVNPYGYTTLPPNENGEYMVYGELYRVDGVGVFANYVPTLGGGSSAWVWNGGGAANCVATLYLYPGFHSAPIIELASRPFYAQDALPIEPVEG